jgi:hypothetical protein
MQVLKSESEKLSGGQKVCQKALECFISVQIFRNFLLLIIKCASFHTSEIEPVSRLVRGVPF